MHRLAVAKAEYLHFDVASVADVALEENSAVAERTGRHALSRFRDGSQGFRLVDDAHADAAAAAGRLDQQRKADRLACRFQSVEGAWLEARAAWKDRHAGSFGNRPRARFVAHGCDAFRAGTDKDQSGLLPPAGEVRVLR